MPKIRYATQDERVVLSIKPSQRPPFAPRFTNPVVLNRLQTVPFDTGLRAYSGRSALLYALLHRYS